MEGTSPSGRAFRAAGEVSSFLGPPTIEELARICPMQHLMDFIENTSFAAHGHLSQPVCSAATSKKPEKHVFRRPLPLSGLSHSGEYYPFLCISDMPVCLGNIKVRIRAIRNLSGRGQVDGNALLVDWRSRPPEGHWE